MFSGVVFMPVVASAGFLASFLGNDAFAESDASAEAVKLPKTDANLQNIALLEANVSSAISQARDNKSSEWDEDQVGVNTSRENANIVSDNSLLPATGPMSASGGKDTADVPKEETSVYVVRKDDSISQIAEMFDVSVNTILWANDMKRGDKIKEGDVLFILPISGLEHTVAKGQTIESIAKLYKADVNEILQYNDIEQGVKLVVGDKLMIPNAEKAEENDKPVKDLGASIAKDKQYYENHPIKNLAGYYINPVPGYRKSQGIHDQNAVDLAIAKGTPIHAAASGTVILARSGYNGGFGNLVIISHPNGTETLYAHQSKIATNTGAQVSQGEVIGYVGSTGRSTGPHLHFEVHGARNPGTDGSWKY